MINWNRVRALIKKETSQAYKDPSSIITAFVFPLILLFLYGLGVSLDMQGIRIGIVVEDTSPIARSFVHSILGTKYFAAQTLTNRKEAEDLITSGGVHGILVIPSYFSKYFYDEAKTAPIQVIADGSSPNTAQFVQNYVRAAWSKWLEELAIDKTYKPKAFIKIVPRVWFNEELSSHYFLVPGSIVIIITVTGALLTSLVIAREWERGTMEALMSTPTTMGEIVISKLVTYFVLGLAALLLCFFVTHFIYGVPFRGSLIALLLSSIAYLSFALGTGLLISISVHDQFAASQIAIFSTYLPAFILSGFIFDTESMPIYLRFLTHFVPGKYFVNNLKTNFLVGDIWSILLPNILFMSFFALVIFFFIKKKCIKRLD